MLLSLNCIIEIFLQNLPGFQYFTADQMSLAPPVQMAGQYVKAYLQVPFFDPGAILKLETGHSVVVSKTSI
jgi:hypothetical protein